MSEPANPNIPPKPIYFALYENVQLLDVAGPAEVFCQANIVLQRDFYDVIYVSSSSVGTVRSSAGLRLGTKPLPTGKVNVHTLVLPGADIDALNTAIADKALMDWVRKAADRSERNLSVCTGAFILGAIGLLNKRQVTTHWAALDMLQELHPLSTVAKDALYMKDGNLWTSAGVLSGVDMALAIVSEDLGSPIALTVARILVVFLFRDGGQSQFSNPLDLQAKASRGDLLNLISWLQQRLNAHITVDQMADQLAISVRTLHRRCQATFAMTPAQLLSELRLEHSRTLLHDPLPLKVIADQCGFGHAAAFSKAFTQRFGIAPGRYRQRFRDQKKNS